MGRAHRIALELSGIRIPAGMVVDHKCRVRHCVNPDHLYVGTHKNNVLDNIVRGRYLNNGLTNSLKTHCKRGHEFTVENTYNHSGRRYCKACWKLRCKGA